MAVIFVRLVGRWGVAGEVGGYAGSGRATRGHYPNGKKGEIRFATPFCSVCGREWESDPNCFATLGT